jgi:hypothetical protein
MDENNIERAAQLEILQQKPKRPVEVFHCQIFETVVSQYCGHNSAAGVTR